MRNQSIILCLLTVFLTSLSGLAIAKHNSGGGAGGKSGEHMSTEGAANTNGQRALDRDKGRDRAEDRKEKARNRKEHKEERKEERKEDHQDNDANK